MSDKPITPELLAELGFEQVAPDDFPGLWRLRRHAVSVEAHQDCRGWTLFASAGLDASGVYGQYTAQSYGADAGDLLDTIFQAGVEQGEKVTRESLVRGLS